MYKLHPFQERLWLADLPRHTHPLDFGIGTAETSLMGFVTPQGIGIEHLQDGSITYHLPPEGELIPSRQYDYLRLLVAKQYGLTLAQTDGMTAREILERASLNEGATTIHIE
jgi:hypothetical protein